MLMYLGVNSKIHINGLTIKNNFIKKVSLVLIIMINLKFFLALLNRNFIFYTIDNTYNPYYSFKR